MSTGEATGCGHAVMYRWNSVERKWYSVLDRATFDLSCPKDQIQVQELGSKTQVGVSGCDKKATYVLTSHGWIQNTDTDKTE